VVKVLRKGHVSIILVVVHAKIQEMSLIKQNLIEINILTSTSASYFIVKTVPVAAK